MTIKKKKKKNLPVVPAGGLMTGNSQLPVSKALIATI
jgi:hypothetical protein